MPYRPPGGEFHGLLQIMHVAGVLIISCSVAAAIAVIAAMYLALREHFTRNRNDEYEPGSDADQVRND